MMSLLIEAKERRDVATADVVGAYLHADMDDFTLLKVEGASVDILCSVSEEYKKYVVYEHGKKVLYLLLLKALYGCVKSALLWYDLFPGTLEEKGFYSIRTTPALQTRPSTTSSAQLAGTSTTIRFRMLTIRSSLA